MKDFRSTVSKTLRDHIQNKKIREELKVEQLSQWLKNRKSEWDDHVRCTGSNRIVKSHKK